MMTAVLIPDLAASRVAHRVQTAGDGASTVA